MMKSINFFTAVSIRYRFYVINSRKSCDPIITELKMNNDKDLKHHGTIPTDGYLFK